MLARRIIPCLDVAGGRVVKGVHFESLRDAGDPVEQAARYDAEGADELVFLDISASPDQRRTTLEMVARVADSIFIPFTVGGGIRSVVDAGAALRSGADKVAVNTAAVRDPSLVSRLADSFGSQCTVAAVDASGRLAWASRRVTHARSVLKRTRRSGVNRCLSTTQWISRVTISSSGDGANVGPTQRRRARQAVPRSVRRLCTGRPYATSVTTSHLSHESLASS